MTAQALFVSRMQLLPHPSTRRGPVREFEAMAERRADGRLLVSWRLDADLSKLMMPGAGSPARATGLWRRTCFEAFVAIPGAPAYCEFNFSPSGEWAAYAFTGYRDGMAAPDLPMAPQAQWRRRASRLELDVSLRLDGLLAVPADAPLHLALAAVIEEQSGTIGHWALRHPEGRPDFHSAEGFVLEIAGSPPAAKWGPGKT